MKKVFLSVVLTIFFVASSFACDFEFSTKNDLKSVKAGDEIVINVVLKLTHRSCKVAAQDTKFKYDGIQILGATDWKQDGAMTFTRQIKAKVLNDGKKNIMLTATRTCDKEGGHGIFTLSKQ